jgi:hypothetical protein
LNNDHPRITEYSIYETRASKVKQQLSKHDQHKLLQPEYYLHSPPYEHGEHGLADKMSAPCVRLTLVLGPCSIILMFQLFIGTACIAREPLVDQTLAERRERADLRGTISLSPYVWFGSFASRHSIVAPGSASSERAKTAEDPSNRHTGLEHPPAAHQRSLPSWELYDLITNASPLVALTPCVCPSGRASLKP